MADHRFHISVLFCAVGFEQCRLLSPSSHPPPNQHGSPKGTIVLQKGTILVLGKVTPKAKFAVGKLEAHRTGKRPPCLRLPFSNWGSLYQGLMGPLGVFRLKALLFQSRTAMHPYSSTGPPSWTNEYLVDDNDNAY